MARKKGAVPQVKSENIGVRLDPKIRYGVELLIRKERRNLSSVVEWALHKVINDPEHGVDEILRDIWDVDEADRFIKLATAYSYLLTFSEQQLWKKIKENKELWEDNELDVMKLREIWPMLSRKQND